MTLDPNEPNLTPEQQLNRIRMNRAMNRRNFMVGLGAAGAAVAGAGMLAGCGDRAKTSPPPVLAAGITEADILNFALNLEYLEAQFYSFALTGAGLSATVTGPGAGAITGGVQTNFIDPILREIAAEILADETHHVTFLQGALTAAGATPVAQPALFLSAVGDFSTQTGFLTASRAFEDTGVSAYAGAATGLTGSNLQAAAQILGTEAYHASMVRLKLIENGVPAPPKIDSQDIPPARPSSYFPVDSNSLAFKRTPSQVLMIVYANTSVGVSSGGFFPAGLNGTIKTT